LAGFLLHTLTTPSGAPPARAGAVLPFTKTALFPVGGQGCFASLADLSSLHVTLLTGVRNGAPFPPDQLDSFAAKIHQNWHLSADDGSSDDSADILRRCRRAWGEHAPFLFPPPAGFGAGPRINQCSPKDSFEIAKSRMFQTQNNQEKWYEKLGKFFAGDNGQDRRCFL
jgi:hypothetical protein